MSTPPPGGPHPFGSPAALPADAATRNPYAAGTAIPGSRLPAGDATAADAESIRRYHIKHEASVKSIGTLYMLGAIFLIPAGLFFIGMTVANAWGQARVETGFAVIIGGIYLLIGGLQAYTALGLRRLNPVARRIAIALSCFGLLGFPIGTLISAYFLYLLLSEKGKMLFTPQYHAIVQQTPHVKYRTSILVWILVAILGTLFIVLMVAAFTG